MTSCSSIKENPTKKHQGHAMKNEILLPEWGPVPDLFNDYATTVDKILKGINDLQVVDASSCKLAINTSSDVKLLLKDIVSIRNKTTDPYKKFVNMINESAKEFIDKLDMIQQIITQKVATFEIQQKIQAEIAQKEREITSEGSELSVSFISINEEKIASTAKTIVSHRVEKTFSVVNEYLIPREYLRIDEDKIKKAIKLGISEIPGISITENKKIVLRRR